MTSNNLNFDEAKFPRRAGWDAKFVRNSTMHEGFDRI